MYLKCDEENYLDPQLKDWRPVQNEEELSSISQQFFFKTDKDSYIYCLYHKKIINGRERSCPPYPFSLPLNVPFKLDNLSHEVTNELMQQNERVVQFSIIDSPNKTDEDDDRDNNLPLAIKNNNERSRERKRMFYIGDDGVNIPWDKNLLICVGVGPGLFLVTIIVLFCCLFRSRSSSSGGRTGGYITIYSAPMAAPVRPIVVTPPELPERNLRSLRNQRGVHTAEPTVTKATSWYYSNSDRTSNYEHLS